MKPLGRNGVTKDAQNAVGHIVADTHVALVARLVLTLCLDGLSNAKFP